MRTFINVLYRRILYKIPLKLLLVLLAVFGILFACFSSAANLPTSSWEGNFFENGNFVLRHNSITVSSATQYTVSSEYDFYCFRAGNGSAQYSLDNSTWNNVAVYNMNCYTQRTIYFRNGEVRIYYFKSGQGVVPAIMSSLECQTQYSLIPVSSVDSEYCTNNNLCPSFTCPTVGVSNLFINDLFHPGAFNIIMNIPDEIDWDYAYTNSGQNMNIDVVGYNVDYQAIEDKVVIQNYKPDSSDLSKIISSIIPLFVPGLCIILLLYFIFKFIKKIF